MMSDDSRLDSLFQTYRASCPDIEPSSGFTPELWRRIEARRTFGFVFQRLARAAVTACAALCLLMLALNLVGGSHNDPSSYFDALVADHSAENTYYTEAIRSAPTNEEALPDFGHSR